jgi:hypothetical protein
MSDPFIDFLRLRGLQLHRVALTDGRVAWVVAATPEIASATVQREGLTPAT